MQRDQDTFSLKKAHVVVALIGAIISAFIIPMLSAYSSYTQSLVAIDQKLEQFKTESAKTYVVKDDLKEVSVKLDLVSDKISALDGYIRAQNHQPLHSR